MSIYIKGMEIPTSCFYCPFRIKVDPDDIMCIVTKEVFEETFAGTIETRNRDNCPLIPVPEHGRLIDGDVLFDFILNIYKTAQGDARKAYRDVLDTIADSDDVIPADKEGER